LIFQPKTFNNEKPNILHIGTKENKNLIRLIEAIKEIPCTLTILGKISNHIECLLNSYRIEYTNLYNIKYEDVINLYCKSDILAFVSTYEGFGMPILEAQSLGRVVLTSNVASMPEVAGNGALFVNPTDISDIKSGLLRLISDKNLREELIAKGLLNTQKFSVEKIVNSYVNLYTEIIENKQL
jgi:glycosyltransferase involved in cell wall biosynthesis